MKNLNQESVAILAGVSLEYGVDLVMTFPSSVNIAKFKTYLDGLRSKYFFEDICIYMDNLAVHRSRIIKERLDELSIAYVYNPPYSPEFNGIETVFSIFKTRFKKKRLQYVQQGKEMEMEKEIQIEFDNIKVL